MEVAQEHTHGPSRVLSTETWQWVAMDGYWDRLHASQWQDSDWKRCSYFRGLWAWFRSFLVVSLVEMTPDTCTSMMEGQR